LGIGQCTKIARLLGRRIQMNNKIDVLDQGYVRLVDTMGNDLSVANAARVSYDKQSNKMSERDAKLIKFLWDEKHTSPFRHAAMTFEVYAPLFVARQWWKHAVASTHLDDQNGWNESSRRYITENEEFYLPKGDEWRSKPENSKQGSGEPLSPEDGGWFTNKLFDITEMGKNLYNKAMDAGIAPEQARLFLPAYGMYVRWRWTVSLHGVLTFLDQRLPSDAQYEIREYAEAVKQLTKDSFPYTYEVALSNK
jgi:thymidylate synthase (FAD)